MAQELDQAQRRRPIVYRDDWGRKWESTIDITEPSLAPCAPINPKGWNDPLNTPQNVLTRALGKDEDGRPMLRLKDSYTLWRDFLKAKHAEYDQTLYNDAVMLFGQEGPRAYEQKSPALLNYTGEPPQAWEPIEAALQGNSAALGLKPLASDPRVAKYFAKKEVKTVSFKDEELENLMDIEESVDPDATGGKKVPVGRPKQERAPKAAA